MTVTLRIDGPPVGKGRPRFNRNTGRTYTPSDTMRAEDRFRAAWQLAGRPWVSDGPILLTLVVVVTRPGSHFRVNGELSKAGLRSQWPTKKPDLDNVLKLAADSLNGCAYKDDAQIVTATVVRRWANPGEREHMLLTLAPIEAGGVRVLKAAA